MLHRLPPRTQEGRRSILHRPRITAALLDMAVQIRAGLQDLRRYPPQHRLLI